MSDSASHSLPSCMIMLSFFLRNSCMIMLISFAFFVNLYAIWIFCDRLILLSYQYPYNILVVCEGVHLGLSVKKPQL